jgi:N-acetylglucosaminyl-diphospho-decaprenol L-rhamnosyltransferase
MTADARAGALPLDGAPVPNHDAGLRESRTTVVIATRDREHELSSTLAHLEELPMTPRVIVVDNGSPGPSVQRLVRAHPSVKFIPLGSNVGCGARTIGAEHADTPYVAFCDDDSWWDSRSLSEAESLFDSYPRLGAIAATVLVGTRNLIDPTMELMRRGLPRERTLPGIPVLGFLACGSIVRRKAFFDVGGFEGRFGIGGEETLLAMDLAVAGWGVVWMEDLTAHHHPSLSRDADARRVIEMRNRVWTAWLRRPLPVGFREVLNLLQSRSPIARRATCEAIRGLPWVLRERRKLPGAIERRVQYLDERRAEIASHRPQG